jgi:hypothetical protein
MPPAGTGDVAGLFPAQILSGALSLTAGRWEMRFDWRTTTGSGGRVTMGALASGDNLLFSSEAWADQFEGEVDDGLVAVLRLRNDNQGGSGSGVVR